MDPHRSGNPRRGPPTPGDADFIGPHPKRTWKLVEEGEGAHLVQRANVRGRAALALFDQPGTPRFYPSGTPENAGAAHTRLHQATRDAGIELQAGGNGNLSDKELLQRFIRAYSDPSLNGIRGDLRTPDGKLVLGRNVTPAEAFALLLKWAGSE